MDETISVELTDPNELHCFKLIFCVKPAMPDAPEDDRMPLEIFLRTRQAFHLFNELGQRLMDYFATHSLDLLKKIGERDEQRRLLEMASHALHSYQHGNSATESAAEQADAIDRFLATGEPQTLVGKERE